MNKFIILITIIFATNISIFTQPFGGGDGSDTLPYRIYTKAHLEEISDSINTVLYPGDAWSKGKYFVLMNDITDSLSSF